MTGYSDDMRDYDFEKSEFVKLIWININGVTLGTILPFDKTLKMKKIIEGKGLPAWIEKC